MANRMYDYGRQSFTSKLIDWNNDTIKVALVSTGYAPMTATDQFLSALGANRLGTDQTLTGKSNPAGVCKAANVTWTTTPSTGTLGFLVIYQDTGVAGTSILIALIDTASVNGGVSATINLVLNGGSITYTTDATNGIFKI